MATEAATAKYSWSSWDRVILKLKRSDNSLKMNTAFPAERMPDGMTLYDADGDAVANAAFVDIRDNFSIQYDGTRYHFKDPIPLRPQQQQQPPQHEQVPLAYQPALGPQQGGSDLFLAEQQKQQWYHVTGLISRQKTHAGARRELFKFASSGGLYPQGLDANTAFEAKALRNDSDRTMVRFSVVFKSDDRALQFIDNIGKYLISNQGDLQLFDYSGEGALERPAVSEISPYPTTFASKISALDYKPQNGEADPGSPVVDVLMETRSADFTVDVTLLSTRDEVFRFQRIEKSASFALAEPEAAHIFPSAKCSETYEWLDDKPYNRLALSRDVHLNFDGTGRGRGKRRKTAQVFAIRPNRPDGGFRTCEIEGVICYEIPLELIVNENDKAEALLAKLGNNSQLHKKTSDRWTIDGADVRVFYPQNRRVELVAEPTDDDGPIDLVTAVPGVNNLSECWSQSDQNPLSLEAAEVLEKCLFWNYENALDTWSKLG